MAKKIIDMSQSPRAGQFAYFSAMADPWAGATVMVDITDFLSAIREKGLPFFLSFLFAVTRAGNAVPEPFVDWMKVWWSGITPMGAVHLMLRFCCAAALISDAVYFLVTRWILVHKLNLE